LTERAEFAFDMLYVMFEHDVTYERVGCVYNELEMCELTLPRRSGYGICSA